jgi:hypothetical protein
LLEALGAVDVADSLDTISESRREVSSMTSTGFLSPTKHAYGLAAMANDYTDGSAMLKSSDNSLCRRMHS